MPSHSENIQKKCNIFYCLTHDIRGALIKEIKEMKHEA